MSHGGWRARLSPFIDGELSAEEARRVARHLEGCVACRERLEQLRRVSASIRQMERHPMPGDLRASILREADGASRASRAGFWGRSPWALASLASAALVMTVLVIGHRHYLPGEDGLLRRRPAAGDVAPELAAKEGSRGGGPQARGAVSAPEAELDPEARTKKVDLPAASAAPGKAAEPAPEAPPGAQLRIGEDAVGRGRAPSRPPSAKLDAVAPQTVARDEPAEQERFISLTPEAAVAGQDRSRFTTAVILADDGSPALAPVVPLGGAATGGASRQERPAAGLAELRAAHAPAQASEEQRHPAAAPRADAGLQRSRTSRALADRRGPAAVLDFLVRIGPDGRIQSAEPVGAQTEGSEVVRAVASLLTGASVAPHAPASARYASVEVRLPPSDGR